MVPIGPLTHLDRCIDRFVDAGDCLYPHRSGAGQQPHQIVGEVHSAFRLEDVPA